MEVLRGDGPLGFDVFVDQIAGGVFAAAAATGDGEVGPDFIQRGRATINYVANLAVADGMTDANEHGCSGSVI